MYLLLITDVAISDFIKKVMKGPPEGKPEFTY